MSETKPLFIPLKTEYYRAFENGSKRHEYRLYGRRWNEKVCVFGRAVILSRGYSTPDRLSGTITSFRRVHAPDLPVSRWPTIHGLYGKLTGLWLAEIEIEVNRA